MRTKRAMTRALIVLVVLGCGKTPADHMDGGASDGNASDDAADDSCAWDTQTIEPFVESISHESVVIDPTGSIHVSYVIGAYHELRYAVRTGTTWTDVTVDPFADGTRSSVLALDVAG